MVSRVLGSLSALLIVPLVHAQAPPAARTDSLGDPLPPGAVARIGTLRFKHNPAHSYTVDVVQFAPDGSKIVSLSEYCRTVRLWDAATGKEIAGPWSSTNRPRGMTPDAVAFAPDATKMAVAFNSDFDEDETPPGQIIVYDLRRGQTVKTITGMNHFGRALVFTSDGKTLVSAGEGTVCWWDLASGKEKRSWAVFADDKSANRDGKTKTFINCALAPDARSLAVEVAWAVVPVDGEAVRARVAEEALGFDLGTRTITWRSTCARTEYEPGLQLKLGDVFTGQKCRIALSANGKRVAVPGDQRKVEVRNAATGKLLSAPLRTNDLSGEVLGLALSSDGSQLAAAFADGQVLQVFLCNINNASGARVAPRKLVTRVAQNEPGLCCLNFSPDDKKLVIGVDSDVQVYDVATLQETQPWEGHRGWIDFVHFAVDGKALLTGSGHNDIHPREHARWDTTTWKRVQVTSIGSPPWPNVGVVSPDQSVYADESGTALYSLKTGKLDSRLDQPRATNTPWPQKCMFSPSGKHYLLAFKTDKGIGSDRLYGVLSGKLRCELPAQAFCYQAGIVAFSPDERLIAILGEENLLHVHDTATGKQLHCLESAWRKDEFADRHFVASLAFSTDNKYLASWITNVGEQDPGRKPIRVWNMADGNELAQIAPENSNLRHAAYERVRFAWSPDGRVLAVGQHKIRLWEMATLGIRRELPGHGDASVQGLSFSPDGRLLASGATDTTVLIWDVSTTGGVPGSAVPGVAMAPPELEKRWGILAADDAAKAYVAIRELVATPAEAVAWIKERVKPVEAPDSKLVQKLIAQLGDEEFKTRQKAFAELLQIGEQLVPTIDQALARKPALETSSRLQNLRKSLTNTVIKGPRLQAHRAIEVLEYIGTPEARRVLETLASGAPGALVTTQARAALTRLQR
jgi:WD40 repeat protein